MENTFSMKSFKASFFYTWSILFLFITVIGFLPTFILRPLFRETSLPSYLIIHGIFMLFWFAIYFVQNLWVKQNKLLNHKKFGMYWFLLAVFMVISNFNVVVHLSNEIVSGQMTYFGKIRTYENSGGFIIGNLYITIFSSLFLLLAFLKRNKPEAHRRAIFGASFILLTPAFDRFIRPFGLPEIFQYVGSFVIPISLLIYDLKIRKKIHPMTWGVMAMTFLMIPVLMSIMNNESYIKQIVLIIYNFH